MFKLNSLNSLRALRHLHAFQSAGVKALTTCSSLLLKQSNPLLSPSPSPSAFTPSHKIHVVRNYQSSRDLRPRPLKVENEKQLQKSSNGDPAVAYSSRSGEELVKECITKGTELVQAIANSLFNLPSTEDIDGPIVQLSLPEAKLPRYKHLPVPKPPTKWETFAKTKGISLERWLCETLRTYKFVSCSKSEGITLERGLLLRVQVTLGVIYQSVPLFPQSSGSSSSLEAAVLSFVRAQVGLDL